MTVLSKFDLSILFQAGVLSHNLSSRKHFIEFIFNRVPEFKSKRKDALKVLKQAWIDSDFRMSKGELVEMLKQITKDTT